MILGSCGNEINERSSELNRADHTSLDFRSNSSLLSYKTSVSVNIDHIHETFSWIRPGPLDCSGCMTIKLACRAFGTIKKFLHKEMHCP